MDCPICQKRYVISLDKVDVACIIVWGQCRRCLKKKERVKRNGQKRR